MNPKIFETLHIHIFASCGGETYVGICGALRGLVTGTPIGLAGKPAAISQRIADRRDQRARNDSLARKSTGLGKCAVFEKPTDSPGICAQQVSKFAGA